MRAGEEFIDAESVIILEMTAGYHKVLPILKSSYMTGGIPVLLLWSTRIHNPVAKDSKVAINNQKNTRKSLAFIF